MKLFLYLLLLVVFSVSQAKAEVKIVDQLAVVTQLQGKARIFSRPSNTLQSEREGIHVRYEGEYYLAKEAKIGDRIGDGNILQTSLGTKAKLIYPNGDQFYVGPATSFRIFFKMNVSKDETRISLMYGKLRGIIEKGGPRTRLNIQTKSAIMGVRGTDFFIAQGGADQSTEVSILRGSVEVTPIVPQKVQNKEPNHSSSLTPSSKGSNAQVNPTSLPIARPKPIEIKAGFSMDIGAAPLLATSHMPAIELRKTTKEEFAGIQKSSTIPKAVPPPRTVGEPSLIQTTAEKAIEALEKKATVNTLMDIQRHDQVLYAKMQSLQLTSGDALNNASMQDLVKVAPKAPPLATRKLYKSEVDDVQAGAYQKYFNENN
jgi:hypothetical protein